MSGFEWFLVIVVVILVPLAIAVAVTLWTLEQARQRNRRNRPGGKQAGVARRATHSEEGAQARAITASHEGLESDGDRRWSSAGSPSSGGREGTR